MSHYGYPVSTIPPPQFSLSAGIGVEESMLSSSAPARPNRRAILAREYLGGGGQGKEKSTGETHE
jgi:hypothetical protein